MHIIDPFAYPVQPHIRRHGPFGYQDYSSYREWLRDEFSFQCVFCLTREQWGKIWGCWDIDHLQPQSTNPQLVLEYENLLYLCNTCNLNKSNKMVSDPCKTALGSCLRVNPDGTITALDSTGKRLISLLRLSSDRYNKYRRLVIETLNNITKREIINLWLSYPDDLPDLSRLRPPGNTKPEGINNSHFARRQRMELPDIY